LSSRLPDALRERLRDAASELSTAQLAASAARMSDAYRRRQPFLFKTEADCVAYALTRLPATFGAVASALHQIIDRPTRLLDLGSGPGTAAFAAQARFGTLEQLTLVERDSGLAALGRRLGLGTARWIVDDLSKMDLPTGHDLVILSYSLGEMPDAGLLARAWAATERWLVVVEPGTPDAYRRMMEVRQELVGHLIAPCPHRDKCPIVGDDWCHFANRVERSREHRQLKGGELSYEDEKFTYLVFDRRAEAPRAAARIVRHPVINKGLIQLRLCTPAGLEDRKVTRKDPSWKTARKAEWGQRWE
jgi:ribosomal protein RSM22 (predicted rRNA methylase)